MALAARWRKVHGDIILSCWRKTRPSTPGGSYSPAGEIMDFSGKNVWVTGAGKGTATPRRWRLLRRERKLQVLISVHSGAISLCDRSDGCCRRWQVAQVCQRLLAETERLDALAMRREFYAWARQTN